MSSSCSPESAPNGNDGKPRPSEHELARKRARDRKSQQAMRNRAKWTLESLTDQVTHLSKALEHESRQTGNLNHRVFVLEQENDQLRAENAALQLRFLGDLAAENDGNGSTMGGGGIGGGPPASTTGTLSDALADMVVVVDELPEWSRLPLNMTPTCLSDQILQGFLGAQLQDRRAEMIATPRPDLLRLINGSGPSGSTNANDVVLDVVKSYHEIDTLPKQVAVHFLMFRLMRWMILQDESSWNQMPLWLRPIPEQLTTAHAAWIDRIPWPQARSYLIAHPEIQLDDFAAVYSSSFDVCWKYDPSFVLISLESTDPFATEVVIINPVFEEHVAHLSNWKVGCPFRQRFPVMSHGIDEDRMFYGSDG